MSRSREAKNWEDSVLIKKNGKCQGPQLACVGSLSEPVWLKNGKMRSEVSKARYHRATGPSRPLEGPWTLFLLPWKPLDGL